MGLTLEDVRKNPKLARSIVAYHTVLGVAAGPKELFAKNDTILVPTVAPGSHLTAKKRADGVYLYDTQGNEAKVVKAGLGSGKHTVHIIDKVLYSGSYFKDLAAIFKLYPDRFSAVAAAAAKAGMADSLTKQGFTNTIFLPTNEAFKKAKIDPSTLPKASLEPLLSYHIVPGVHRIPAGFESGKAVSTLLKGQDLTVTYKDEGKRGTLLTRRAFVTDSQGSTVMVIKPNIIISKAVAHVTDGMLSPKGGSSSVSSEAGNKPAGTKGRKLMQGSYYMPTNGAYFVPSETLGTAWDPQEQSIDNALSNDGPNCNASPAGQFDGDNNCGALMYPDYPTYKYGK